MTLLDDLHAIRVRANLIERNVSALRPDQEDGREWETWCETMALTSEQFHGVMIAIRQAVELELGCGPIPEGEHSVAVEPELDAIETAQEQADYLHSIGVPVEPRVSLPRSRTTEPVAVPQFVVESSSSSSWAWTALAIVAVALSIGLAVALIMVTT